MLDAPLLFESKILAWICHPIITVAITDKDKQRERLMNRNKALSKQEADAKIDSQMPIGNKMDKSDIVVKNSGSKD